jgi:hypothetical protein
MRNDDNHHESPDRGPWPHDGSGARVYTSDMARRSRRRKRALAGVAGLVVILGGGALAATQLRDSPATTTAGDVGVLAPGGATGSAPVVGPVATSGSAAVTPAPSASSKPAASPSPLTAKQRAAAARSAAAEAGTAPRQPIANKAGGAYSHDVTVRTSGTVRKDRRTLKVVSAKQDLTGQRELAWAADAGEAVGDARCTQTFQFSKDQPAGEKPTLLLCWRTSAEKSVYTVAVDLDKRPSKSVSVAEIAKAWAKLA